MTYFRSQQFSLTAGQTSPEYVSNYGIQSELTLLSGNPAPVTLQVFNPLTGTWITEDALTLPAGGSLVIDSQGFRYRIALAGGYSGTALFLTDGAGLRVRQSADDDEIVAVKGVLVRKTDGSTPDVPVAPGGLNFTLTRTLDSAIMAAAMSVAGAPSGSPDAPTLAGMNLIFDFDFGSLSAGAFPTTLGVRAGSATAATAVVGGGTPVISTVTGSRRGVVTDGVDDWVSLTGILAGLLPVNPDPEFIIYVVGRKGGDGSLAARLFDISRANQSGATSLNRYTSAIATAGTSCSWSRADGSNISAATLAAGVTLTNANTARVALRASLNGDQINRGMVNGGTKSGSAARSVTSSPGAWTRTAIGATLANSDGTTMSGFLPTVVERIFGYYAATPNSATDAALDSIETAMATYYS